MTTRPLLRRNSYDQFRAENDDESGSTYTCACGQEYMSEETLKQHQQTNCKNQPVRCSFCQEICSSSAKLREHLLVCGNKTDQCPNCRQLIRRSHFAYHYENNCAPLAEVETPPLRPKRQSNQHHPTNLNTPASREDVPTDDYPDRNSPMYPPRVNGRIQSPISNPRNSPGIMECEYCHNQCAPNDYKTHRDNCLRNPTNINYKAQPQRIPLRPNQSQNNSNGIVHLPCEICNQPIDVPNWSIHMQNCRERETQRLAKRANLMSKEPVTEQLPCEYCQQLYSANQIQLHERNCQKNPENIDSAARLARPRPTTSVSLPIRSRNNGSQPKPFNDRSPKDPRIVHYQSIDVDQTHAANISSDNDRLINRTNTNQHPIRLTASEEILSEPGNARRDVHTYDNELIQSNEHRSHENLIRPYNPRPANGTPQRPRSSFDNLRNIEETEYPSNGGFGNRSPHNNDPKYKHHVRDKQQRFEVIDNQPDRPLTKKHKKSWFKKYCCGIKDGNHSD